MTISKRLLIFLGVGVIFLACFSYGLFLTFTLWRGLHPQPLSTSDATSSLATQTATNLTVAPGYQIRVYSRDVVNPSVMIFDQQGRLLVSEPAANRISVFTNGNRQTLLDHLNQPYGLALLDPYLYVAESGDILRYPYDEGQGSVGTPTVLLDLPKGGEHWTRSLGIGPDKALYVSIGSSCNECVDADWRRQSILRYDLNAQSLGTEATGLRDALAFTWQPGTNRLFAADLGRSQLNDHTPPDELNLIVPGGDYGYPYCYGGDIPDPQYNNPGMCSHKGVPFYQFQAQESPEGLAFFQNDLWVALHGSTTRSQPDGFEIVRFTSASNLGDRQTMVSGWLQPDGTVLGRPTGLTAGPDGKLYISDDTDDAIYVLSPV